MAPNTSAHGLKIEQMNMTATATAEMNGQMLGIRAGLAHVGRGGNDGGEQQLALVDAKAMNDRQLASASHNGVRLSTAGICAKLYDGGGEAVAHSSVGASHGLGPAARPPKTT